MMLGNIFIFHDPNDSEFVGWLAKALEDAGYCVVRTLEQSQIVLFVITPSALNSPWLDHFKLQLYQKRDRADLEIALGALLRGDIHYSTGHSPGDGYDFVVDFRHTDMDRALRELFQEISEGYPEGWRLEPAPAAAAVPASEGGIVNLHLSFPLDVFLTWIRTTQDRLRVVCTWSPLLDYRKELLDAVRRGVDVQFLLLEPNSLLARQRAQDLFHFGEAGAVTDEDEVSRFVRESVRQFNELYAEAEGLSGTFQLRLYETMPSFPIYISDQSALVGFYPHTVRSTSFPHIEIQLGTPFGAEIIQEFERIWVNAAPHRLPTSSEAVKAANAKLPEPLTATELRVLSLVCRGLSNQEIADQLVVQYSTVRAHKNHIYSKLSITSSPTLLVVRAQELGLVSE